MLVTLIGKSGRQGWPTVGTRKMNEILQLTVTFVRDPAEFSKHNTESMATRTGVGLEEWTVTAVEYGRRSEVNFDITAMESKGDSNMYLLLRSKQGRVEA